MYRTIGKYKNEDINIDSLHISGTYGGVLEYTQEYLPICNKKIIERVPKEIERLYGSNRKYLIVGLDTIDYSKKLLSEIVFAWLICNKTVKNENYHGSHLFLAWLQSGGIDPFAQCSKIIKTIDWEKEAEDFEF